jgi:nitroimidazol reductase NimA-like FMN-containing flavoprotein (pyridoxamine 5'-phosphate oxidase superfamily)
MRDSVEMSSAAEFLDDLQERSFQSAGDATRTAYPASNRMSGLQIADYLARRRYLVLATARPDGRPHAAMSSYVLSGRVFWLPTDAGTARVRNLEANPRASIVVTEGEESHHVVVLAEGSTEVVGDEEASEGRSAWRVRFGRHPEWASSWITVAPDKLFSYAASGALEGELKMFRCRSCGDTFPAHDLSAVNCPSCGGSVIETAGEPLL